MNLKDAGKSYDGPMVAEASKTKYYPSFEVDLDKFPELEKEVGDTCVLVIKARVMSKRASETENCQYMEIRAIGTYDEKETNLVNDADQALNRLKNSRRY